MSRSSIEWTDETWNPVTGCTWASPGCDSCYAASMTRRLEAMGQADYAGLTTKKHFNGKVRQLAHKLDAPLRWKKPRMVFVNSMSDLFHDGIPFEFIDRVFAIMALTPEHTYQVLTKRAERLEQYLDHFDVTRLSCAVQKFKPRVRANDPFGTPWLADVVEPFRQNAHLPNVWIGTSVEDQQRAEERVPYLLKCPASVRFLSCEPLLGPLDISGAVVRRRLGDPQPNWVIVGCESGPKRRPMKLDWVADILDQCRTAGVPAFVKQLPVNGRVSHDPSEWPSVLRVREFPKSEVVKHVCTN